MGLVGDCRSVIHALLPLIEYKKKRSFIELSRDRMNDWRDLMKERGTRHDMPMKPQVVTYALNRLLDDDAIVSADSGTIATWAARYIDIRRDMMFSLSGSLATMANGLPYSIGAAVAYPKRQVVCIVGDGGFTMLMGELATLVKHDLRVKVIIIKNNVLGMIKWEQMVLEGNPEYGVELQPIDFEAYAKACGAGGFTIEDPERRDRDFGAGAGPSGPGGGASRGRPKRAADAWQDHHEASDQFRQGARPRRKGRMGDHQDRRRGQGARGGLSDGTSDALGRRADRRHRRVDLYRSYGYT